VRGGAGEAGEAGEAPAAGGRARALSRWSSLRRLSLSLFAAPDSPQPPPALEPLAPPAAALEPLAPPAAADEGAFALAVPLTSRANGSNDGAVEQAGWARLRSRLLDVRTSSPGGLEGAAPGPTARPGLPAYPAALLRAAGDGSNAAGDGSNAAGAPPAQQPRAARASAGLGAAPSDAGGGAARVPVKEEVAALHSPMAPAARRAVPLIVRTPPSPARGGSAPRATAAAAAAAAVAAACMAREKCSSSRAAAAAVAAACMAREKCSRGSVLTRRRRYYRRQRN
jgi:hypothetical protein